MINLILILINLLQQQFSMDMENVFLYTVRSVRHEKSDRVGNSCEDPTKAWRHGVASETSKWGDIYKKNGGDWWDENWESNGFLWVWRKQPSSDPLGWASLSSSANVDTNPWLTTTLITKQILSVSSIWFKRFECLFYSNYKIHIIVVLTMVLNNFKFVNVFMWDQGYRYSTSESRFGFTRVRLKDRVKKVYNFGKSLALWSIRPSSKIFNVSFKFKYN